MSEYIGARISLISKSDIKYIGTLHEINSDSHTVALESVVSYGTEGRKGNPAEEIAGSDHVYEYIVFRGSDVKQLNIVSEEKEEENRRPKVPDDPAILGSSRPGPQAQQQQPQQNQFRGPPPPFQQPPPFGYAPPNQFQNQPRFQGPGGPHGFPGAPGAVPGYGYPPPPGYGTGYGPPPPGQGFQGPPPPGHFPPPNQQIPIGPPGQQRPMPPQQQQQQPPIGSGSKQGTPQPQQQQMPKPPGLGGQPGQPEQPQPPQKPIEMSGTPAPSSTAASSSTGPPPPLDSKPPTAAATAPSGPKRANNRVAIPLPSPHTLAAKPSQKAAVPPAAAPRAAAAAAPAPAPSIQDATQAATAAVAAAMAKLNQGAAQQPQGGAGVDNLTQKVQQMRVNDPSAPRGRSRGRGGPRGGMPGAVRGGHPHAKAIEVPKEDYDFESANAKFNKEDLVKEAIASGSPLTSPPAGGETADPIATAAATTNGDAAGEDVVIPRKASNATGDKYDKKASFFDDISSDLKDRVQAAEGGGMVDGRAMRREERSRNMETFGQGSVDGGYRGGYRGRGRGREYRGGPGGGRGYGGGRGPGYRGRGRGDAELGTA